MYKIYQDEVTILIEHLRFEAHHLRERFDEEDNFEILQDRLITFMEIYNKIENLIDKNLLITSTLKRHVGFLKLYLNKNQRQYCSGDLDLIIEKDLNTLKKLYLENFVGIELDKNLHFAVINLLEHGELDSAVRKGFLILSSKLRAKYNIEKGIDGEELVNRVFGKKGKSKLNDSEKETFRNLLAGMYGLFRNKYMHGEVEENEEMSIIQMINTLMLKIEKLDDL